MTPRPFVSLLAAVAFSLAAATALSQPAATADTILRHQLEDYGIRFTQGNSVSLLMRTMRFSGKAR